MAGRAVTPSSPSGTALMAVPRAGCISSDPRRWQTRFARLVRRYGVAKLALDLQVDPTAIYQWVRGSVSPRPDKAMLIVFLLRSVGRLKLDDIYAHRLTVNASSGPATLEINPLALQEEFAPQDEVDIYRPRLGRKSKPIEVEGYTRQRKTPPIAVLTGNNRRVLGAKGLRKIRTYPSRLEHLLATNKTLRRAIADNLSSVPNVD